MSESNGLPNDTDIIMEARYYADEIARGTKGVTRGKSLALADGFIICDRRRAEQTIRAQTLEAKLLAAEAKVEAMTELLMWLDNGGGLGRDVHARIRKVLGLECRHEFTATTARRGEEE